jgi:hypothetical protein
VSFAIVVFFLPLEAMSVRPLLWSSEHPRGGSSGCDESKALAVVEQVHRPCGLQTGHCRQSEKRYASLTFPALGPLSPVSVSYETFAPSASER